MEIKYNGKESNVIYEIPRFGEDDSIDVFAKDYEINIPKPLEDILREIGAGY